MRQNDHDLLVEIHANCGSCSALVKKHDATLYGNGRTGLVAKMRAVMWLLSFAGGIAVIVLGEWAAAKLTGG